MKTFAVINQKGGVGKTTTALALGSGLQNKGHKVLFVDLDMQGNMTYALGVDVPGSRIESPGEAEQTVKGPSVLEVLTKKIKAQKAIVKTEQGDLIASSTELSGIDMVLNKTGKEFRLRDALKTIADEYDYCVLDTPPSLGVLTCNALVACQEAIIPAQADFFSLQGISQLYETIEDIHDFCNKELIVRGIVLTRHNPRAILSRDVAEHISQEANQYGTKLFNSTIRECLAIKETVGYKSNIFSYAPKSNAAIDYQGLVSEILGEAN